MLAQFKPFMTTARLDGFQSELREINSGIAQTDTSVVRALFTPTGPPSMRSTPPSSASIGSGRPSITP